jgi:hypothetical protein
MMEHDEYARPCDTCSSGNRQQCHVVQEGLDAWSLGVMAFELLTGTPAFGMLENRENVCVLCLMILRVL